MYAVDAATGKVLWKVKVDDHPQAAVTAASALYAGRLYVPVSSREESKVADPKYPCCVFRGSVLALDVATGRRIWKTYMIDEAPMPGHKNSAGTLIMGPSGAPVWNTPTIDVKRNVLYFGTGNNYSPPATSLSDSIVALDMTSGKINGAVNRRRMTFGMAPAGGLTVRLRLVPLRMPRTLTSRSLRSSSHRKADGQC